MSYAAFTWCWKIDFPTGQKMNVNQVGTTTRKVSETFGKGLAELPYYAKNGRLK